MKFKFKQIFTLALLAACMHLGAMDPNKLVLNQKQTDQIFDEQLQVILTFETSDGKEFKVPAAFFAYSSTIKNLIQDFGTHTMPIPLPYIDSKTFARLIKYLNPKTNIIKCMQNQKITVPMLVQLINATNYLELKYLLKILLTKGLFPKINSLQELKQCKPLPNELKNIIINKHLHKAKNTVLANYFKVFTAKNIRMKPHAPNKTGIILYDETQDRSACAWLENENVWNTGRGTTITSFVVGNDSRTLKIGKKGKNPYARPFYRKRFREAEGHSMDGFNQLNFSPDGHYLLVISKPNILIWHIPEKDQLTLGKQVPSFGAWGIPEENKKKIKKTMLANAGAFCFNPTNNELIFVNRTNKDKAIKSCKVSSLFDDQEPKIKHITTCNTNIKAIAINHDGTLLAIASKKCVKTFDIKKKKYVYDLPLPAKKIVFNDCNIMCVLPPRDLSDDDSNYKNYNALFLCNALTGEILKKLKFFNGKNFSQCDIQISSRYVNQIRFNKDNDLLLFTMRQNVKLIFSSKFPALTHLLKNNQSVDQLFALSALTNNPALFNHVVPNPSIRERLKYAWENLWKNHAF